jgi:transcriptional regulator with XRE-family HTH domain
LDSELIVPKTSNAGLDKALGVCLKKHRLRAGLTQTEVGKCLRVSYQQIQKYERGSNKLSAVQLAKIANLLKIAPSRLTELEGRKTQQGITTNNIIRFAKSSEGQAFLMNYLTIEDSNVRRHLLDLLNTLRDQRT